MEDDKQKSTAAFSVDNKIELQKYLEEQGEHEKMCPLKYWLDHQSTLLGIPALSASVERLFSVASEVFRPDRCRLADSTFEKQMCIQCNNKYINF